jgi:hypothetical protein
MSGYAQRTGKMRNQYKIILETPEGKREPTYESKYNSS